MVVPTWTHLRDITLDAKPLHGYWTLAIEYIDHGARLLLEVPETRAEPGTNNSVPNKWKYGEKVCTADGDQGIPINLQNSLLDEAPPGALIAKIGGSRGGKKDGAVRFVVGSYCVQELVDKQRGPLFLAMNFEPGFLIEPSGSILVKISQSA